MPRGSKAAAKAKAISGPAGGEAVATNPSPNPPTPEAPAGYHAGPMGDGGEGETMVTTEPAGPLAPGTGSDLSVCRGSWMAPCAEPAQHTNHVAAVQHAFRFNHHITVSGLHLLLKAITGASPPDNTKSADLRNMLVQAVSEKLFMEWRLASAAGQQQQGARGAPTDSDDVEYDGLRNEGGTPWEVGSDDAPWEVDSDDDMDVVIQMPSGEKCLETVDPTYLVSDVKDMVSTMTLNYLPEAHMRLLHKGRQLVEANTLEFYNIKKHNKIISTTRSSSS